MTNLTLRTKLSLIYSLIVLGFGLFLLVSINLVVSSYLQADPAPRPLVQMRNNPAIFNFQDLSELERERIRSVRLADLAQVQQTSLILLLPLTLFSFILGYWASGIFLSPLTNLASKVKSIKKDNLGINLPIFGNDEIAQITTSFNEMSLNLKQAFDAQEEFVQNAAHEINTPLAALKLNLDLASLTNNRTQINQTILDSKQAVEKLQSLSISLLNLATPTTLQSIQTINLNQLFNDCLNPYQEYIKANKLAVQINCPENLTISTNVASLRLILNNLISNAIKYAKPTKDYYSAYVVINVLTQKHQLDFQVSNSGPNIPSNQFNNLFKRFYRLDNSRNSNTGGTGLGLAIAAEHAKILNTKINVTSQNQLTTFSFSLANC